MTNISQKDNSKKDLKGKKILYIVTQSKWGGAQKYTLELAKYFSKDNEVHIAYGEENKDDSQFLKALKKLDIKTIAIPYLVRRIDMAKDYLALMEMLKIYNAGHYDLVHLNSSKVGLLGSLAARMYAANLVNTPLRIVYTAHGFVFNEPLSKFRKKIYKFSEKISTSIQHLVITVSEADRQSAIDNEITQEQKIFTIHNGIEIDTQDFYDKEIALEKLDLDKNKKYFGTIASFYKTKGYEYLIEAIKILKDEKSPILDQYQWILIGDGPQLDNIKTKAKEHGLESYIKFLGAKDKAHKYIKAFDAFVLPSVKEGLPYTLLEAGLAKVPIIATRVGGVAEIIEDQKTGLLITPANPLSLAKAFDAIKNLDQNIIENNYQNIKNNFSLQKTLIKTKEVYSKLF
jgi:glycosyltransferase involved in cell wall biosynthesis